MSRRLLPSRFACHLPPGGRLSPVWICLQTEMPEMPLHLWLCKCILIWGGSNLSTNPKWCAEQCSARKCIYKILKNFRVEKFLVICWLRQRDIVASDSDIAPLRSAVILYSPPKLAKRISLGVSRISLRSNRTRREANKTARLPYEKSRISQVFFVYLSGLILRFSFSSYIASSAFTRSFSKSL